MQTRGHELFKVGKQCSTRMHLVAFMHEPHEQINAVMQGLDQQVPAVTDFLSRFHLPDSDLDGLLLKAQQSSAETAVQDYLSDHPQRVNYWTTGRI